MRWDSINFDKWCEDGYLGMEYYDDIPRQCGVSVFEKKPYRFTQDVLGKIVMNFHAKFCDALMGTQFKVFCCNEPIALNQPFFNSRKKSEMVSDIVITDCSTNRIVLVANLALSQPLNHVLLQRQSNKDDFAFWLIRFMPNEKYITIHTAKDYSGCFEMETRIPIANTGYFIDVSDVWELPIYDC